MTQSLQRGIVPTRVNASDPLVVSRAIGTLGEAAKTEPYGVRITAGAEAANVRRVSFQVMDRQGTALVGRFRVSVDIADGQYAVPVNTQSVVAVSGTTILRTIEADQSFDLLTDSGGLAKLDVTIVGAASRWFHTWAGGGRLWESEEVVWA